MKTYRLVGFLNLFDIVPDFVYPVFENNDLYYFQDEHNGKIIDFVLVKSSVYPMVTKTNEYKRVLGIKKTVLQIGSKSIYAFQIERGKIICGERMLMLKFFTTYSTNNEILKREIAVFRQELINPEGIKTYIKRQSVEKQKSVSRGYKFFGTGRRKKSIARVYLFSGKGDITINKRPIDDYFGLETLKIIVRQPLVATETADKFDVIVSVMGGGYTSQAGAIRHGIAKALLQVDENYRPVFKKAGFLTRDPRIKVRKKYGFETARRVPQFGRED